MSNQAGRTRVALRSWAVVWLILSACSSSNPSKLPATRQPDSFFGRMVDQITERGCNVGTFICPYGLGPAGEPCDCTDPSGVVIKGRTVK